MPCVWASADGADPDSRRGWTGQESDEWVSRLWQKPQHKPTISSTPCSCLRSWFQRQQTCPTCRMDVLRASLPAQSQPPPEPPEPGQQQQQHTPLVPQPPNCECPASVDLSKMGVSLFCATAEGYQGNAAGNSASCAPFSACLHSPPGRPAPISSRDVPLLASYGSIPTSPRRPASQQRREPCSRLQLALHLWGSGNR